MTEPTIADVMAALERLEHKVDLMIIALAADLDTDEEEQAHTLDGDPMPGERDQNQPL